MVVTGQEVRPHPFNESDVSFRQQSSNSSSSFKNSFMLDHLMVEYRSNGTSYNDAGVSSESESKKSERLNSAHTLELQEYTTNEGVGVADSQDDITTILSTTTFRNNELTSEDETSIINNPQLMQSRPVRNYSNSLPNITRNNSILTKLNPSNSPESHKTFRDNEFPYESIIQGVLASYSKDSSLGHETNLQNVSTDSKDIGIEDMHLLLLKDNELNKTLMESWNETEHFLTSGDLEVGQVAITLLQKYVEKREAWLRRIKHVSLKNNNVTLLIDGTTFEGRKIELKETVEYFNKLRNIYKLAVLVSAMHAYEQNGFLFMRNKSAGNSSWIQEAEKYLKNFENALHDLEDIWEQYNVSGQFMFPWCNSYGLIIAGERTLATLNGTVKNSTNTFEEMEMIFRVYVYPCVYFTILAIGIVGNGTLLLMFARHKEIRTGPNVMVLNLAVTDVFNLFINTPLYYVTKFYSEWIYIYGYGCKMFVIFRFAIHSVLAFSIVALSIQRYCASTPTFRRVSENLGISARLKTFIYVTTVWIAALLCGVPTAVVFEYKNGICFPYVKYQIAVEILDIFYFTLFVFILPTTMIVFSFLTARSLKKSVRRIPGVIRNNNQEASRQRSAKVVISLAIAYSISHIPRSIWFFMLTFFHFSRRENIYIIFVDEITNYLMFSNSCLNPLALYLASTSFRRLFKLYLCRNRSNSERKIIPLNQQSMTSSQSRLMSLIETLSSDFNTSKSSLFERKQSSKVKDVPVCINVNANI
ncbi:hypothetical protein L9F63_006181 [Diploptera punctata]|uniref:G-protein coupled receptors family 1 profile domain-containing protein n=1 Tax=Diploptera punctata TaxID=6984 RepID=A0AAD7ZBE3_DIPPU|nr:hypothetical protein L9F63_006181 [Diploptera punctata]